MSRARAAGARDRPGARATPCTRELRFGVAPRLRRSAKSSRILHGGADSSRYRDLCGLTEGRPSAPEFSEAEIRAAVEEAALYETHVAAHAHGAEGIKRAVRAGVRSIEHGSLMDDESIALMAEHGTFLVADVWMGDWSIEQGEREGWSPNVMRKLARDDRTCSARVSPKPWRRAFGSRSGTDSGTYPHGIERQPVRVHGKYGMTPMDAIPLATVVAAELLGWRDRVGALEPGLFADLVAVRAT